MRLAEQAEFSVDGLKVESPGIERASDPFLHVFMLGVGGVLEYFQELLVAADAAYVFRGCGLLTGEADPEPAHQRAFSSPANFSNCPHTGNPGVFTGSL